jgi:hypothetical protein
VDPDPGLDPKHLAGPGSGKIVPDPAQLMIQNEFEIKLL